MRLGDLLVLAGRVTQSQVEEAARAQVVWGGRLGTNLVELGHIDVDELSVFLGRLHNVPAAQRRHFEQADLALQAQLAPMFASTHGVIPIARLAADIEQIAIACFVPPEPDGLVEIAQALGCAKPDHLVVTVAAELRMLYNLERIYGVPRPSRFLRTKRGSTQEIPLVLPPAGTDSQEELPVPGQMPPRPAEGEALPGEGPVLELVAEEFASEITPIEPTERRRFVRTIADEAEPPLSGTVARISLRRMILAPAVEHDVNTTEASNLNETLRAIRRCRDRERVGSLAIECLGHHAEGTIDAAVLFIVRGPVAVGWKGFATGAAVAFDQLALPLDEPSVLARDLGNAVRRVVVADTALSPLDQKLVNAIGIAAPALVVAAPIAIRNHVIGFVYAQSQDTSGGAEDLVVEVADATRSALTSLLRAAQR